MAEVGLLPFAHIALQVCRAVLPRYRSRFSKHQFTQPQLLAILCLMRYEDWTFREAEVRLGEHRELRQALRLVRCPMGGPWTGARAMQPQETRMRWPQEMQMRHRSLPTRAPQARLP